MVLNVCESDVMQPRGDAGEEADGPERHPEERGGLSETAGGPADGKPTKYKDISVIISLKFKLNVKYEPEVRCFMVAVSVLVGSMLQYSHLLPSLPHF